jgi:hypothetical protein
MIGIVIPHHLKTLEFLNEWEELNRSDVKLYIVEDKDKYETSLPEKHKNYIIYNRQNIKKDFGKNSWIIPTGTSAIRSYGYYKAWKDGCEYILTLDNDCFPERPEYWVDGHVRNLNKKITLGWVSSIPNSLVPTRGFPYLIRENSEVGVSHGLWSNVPDFDGVDMLKKGNIRFKACNDTFLIPKNNYYPMCGMNLAWKREFTPLMYFGLFGKEYGLDQYDDIWAGVFSKKILDHLNVGVISGYPSVEHRKQSNAFINLQKQAPGLILNEELWQMIDKVTLTKENPLDCYKELLDKIEIITKTDKTDYLLKYIKATKIWLNLFAY